MATTKDSALAILAGRGNPIRVIFRGRLPAKNDTRKSSPPLGAGLGVGKLYKSQKQPGYHDKGRWPGVLALPLFIW